MRNHVSFTLAAAGAVLAIGFGLIGVGVAEAQSSHVSNAGLNLWGNTWFLLGFCLFILGAFALLIVILQYTQELRRRRGDTLRAGRRLSASQSLYSSSGRYQLKMQEDGNLVVYLAEKGRSIWSSKTNGSGRSNYVTMQKDGNLVIYTKNGRALWATGTERQGGERLVMQDDGNLVIYTENDQAVWASETSTN